MAFVMSRNSLSLGKKENFPWQNNGIICNENMDGNDRTWIHWLCQLSLLFQHHDRQLNCNSDEPKLVAFTQPNCLRKEASLLQGCKPR